MRYLAHAHTFMYLHIPTCILKSEQALGVTCTLYDTHIHTYTHTTREDTHAYSLNTLIYVSTLPNSTCTYMYMDIYTHTLTLYLHVYTHVYASHTFTCTYIHSLSHTYTHSHSRTHTLRD